jgi:hypothetical protein
MLPAALEARTVQVRFLDSATGCAIQPETVTTGTPWRASLPSHGHGTPGCFFWSAGLSFG